MPKQTDYKTLPANQDLKDKLGVLSGAFGLTRTQILEVLLYGLWDSYEKELKRAMQRENGDISKILKKRFNFEVDNFGKILVAEIPQVLERKVESED